MKRLRKYALRRLQESILDEITVPTGFVLDKNFVNNDEYKFSDGTGPFIKVVDHDEDRGFRYSIQYIRNDNDDRTGMAHVSLIQRKDPKKPDKIVGYTATWDSLKIRNLSVLDKELDRQEDFKSSVAYLKSKNPSSFDKYRPLAARDYADKLLKKKTDGVYSSGFNKIQATDEFAEFEDRSSPLVNNIMSAQAEFEANVFYSGNGKNNNTGKTTIWLRRYKDSDASKQVNVPVERSFIWNEMNEKDRDSLVKDIMKQKDFNSLVSFLSSKNPDVSENSSENLGESIRRGQYLDHVLNLWN